MIPRRMLLVLLFFASCCGYAQTLNVWPGVAPGSEHWTYQERSMTDPTIGALVFNVVTPTITAYLPDKAKATGTGVIIAPGGAFIALAMDLEGNSLARWLQERGVAAFVLKYRLVEHKEGEGMPSDIDAAAKYGIADGIQAVKLVRQHAAEWGVDPKRIGFVGFSAGAMVTSGVLLQADEASRPNFAAPIYGCPFGMMPKIPSRLPPIFMAWAQNDQFGELIVRFYDALIKAGIKPEAHIYSAGGHGFGMKKQGTPSDHWVDEFYWWMESQGLTKPAH